MTTVPTFIRPESIETMTEEEGLAWLEQLRERRLVIRKVMGGKPNDRQRAPADVYAKLEKQYAMLQKEAESLDKIIDKIDKRFRTILTLRIEYAGMGAVNDFPKT
jgi:hypothetical protein